MERFQYRDRNAQSGQIPGAGQAGRPRTDAGDLEVVPAQGTGLGARNGLTGGFRQVGVGHKPFQAANRHGFPFLAQDATPFALGLLRANTAADGRQGIGVPDDLIGLFQVAGDDPGNESRDVDLDGAPLAATGLFAQEAATGLGSGHFRRIAQGHLVEIPRALKRRLLGHEVPHRVAVNDGVDDGVRLLGNGIARVREAHRDRLIGETTAGLVDPQHGLGAGAADMNMISY